MGTHPAVPARGLEPALALLALLGLYAFGWLAVAPNRLVSGTSLGAAAALGWGVHAIAVLILGAVALRRWRPGLAPALPVMLLVLAAALALGLTGDAARHQLQELAPAARAMLGFGFWLGIAALLVLLAEVLRGASIWLRVLAPLLLLGIAALAGWLGLLDRLSLVVEYQARAETLHAALLRHLALAGAALGIVLAFGIPLGWWAFRSPRAEAALAAVLNAVQIVPALALFGALIPLLSALLRAVPALRGLGVEAIGTAPTLIGTAAYAGLPLWRGILAGLAAAPREVVGVAEAMGMDEARVTRAVRLPLGLPVFLAALRVAAVQCIGLVALGGLIGAGGLGALVLEGMAQFATDLILLGALPIVALALLADGALRLLEGRLAPWRR
ncbi:ABC transporter permease subunit [Roseomonas hellenica]|uniref:ABC transporter permease subunit n=1 Tax=Plastoroseomonas hellenica TaxID=2687306 RepID=A0ABS5F7Q7_9PROT|nr:ABC transporter permease subunit [Plastoroseomonas hellenica]